jgi:hypothetical protein
MPRPRAVTHRIVDGEMLPSIPTLAEPRFSQSLERGLAILGCFTPEQPVWGIADSHQAQAADDHRQDCLRAELQRLRRQSLATAEEELVPGMYSTAAPIRSESREVVAAVGMDAHASMIALADLVDALGPHLISTADRVSARLGYRRDDELPSLSVYGSSVMATDG